MDLAARMRQAWPGAARCCAVVLALAAALLVPVFSWGATEAAAPGAPLVLDDATGRVEAWPAVTHLPEPPGAVLDWRDAQARASQFTVPSTAYATLGHRRDAVWLRVPLQVAAGSDGQWVLDIDYAVLNRVDVTVVGPDGSVVRQARLGNGQPFDARPLRSRSHALELHLASGAVYDVYLRVQTLGGMIVPISFAKPQVFLQRALGEQMLQGLLTGLGLCLVLYSLAQWLSLREPLFIKYVVLIGGSLLFSVVQFGIGAQFLWGPYAWPEMHLAGIAALVAAAGTFLFVEEVLASDARSRWFSPVMKTGAALLLATAVLYAFDVIDVHAVSAVVGTLGLMPALMGLPGAVRRLRRGDPVGWTFLVAWLGYFITTSIAIGVIRGRIPANVWTLHAFQFGATLDMVLFLRVLGLRLSAVHAAARQAAQEADVMRTLAETDPLTGLPNRRGLNSALEAALPFCRPERMLALLLLDLDGFKQVNDQHGHEVGDHLLMAVAHRLRTNLRSGDVVARLGGDEFIIMVEGLQHERLAAELGNQLIEALKAPFDVQGRQCRVGLTIGYVLAPEDGRDATALLKRADAAMYRGKERGKGCVMRGEGVTGLV